MNTYNFLNKTCQSLLQDVTFLFLQRRKATREKSPASPPIRYDASASSPIACLEMNRNVVHTTVMNTAGTRLIRQFFPFIVRYTVMV